MAFHRARRICKQASFRLVHMHETPRAHVETKINPHRLRAYVSVHVLNITLFIWPSIELDKFVNRFLSVCAGFSLYTFVDLHAGYMEPLLGKYHIVISLICWQIQYTGLLFLIDALGSLLAEVGKAVITLSSILFKICFLIAFCLYNRTAGSCPLQMEVIYTRANNPHSCDPSCI